jgi:GDP-mannose 6-dehydrogenase
MKISVLGLGYVGAVSAACLAREGHDVVGVDPERTKVSLVNGGQSPVVERDLGEIVKEQVSEGRLCATVDVEVAVRNCDVLIVCVAAPSRSNGDVDLAHVKRVCEQLGNALKTNSGAPVVVIRSTLLPGSVRGLAIPTLEQFSKKRAGTDFGICYNPDALREGSAVHDYYHPQKTVIGELNKASGDRLAALYDGLPGVMVRTDIETAEMVKYTDNAWHAMKVAFANEIGVLSKALDVDAHSVMEIFCQDTKLNISTSYLKPGFAFGGNALPRDLRALLHKARALNLDLPLLAAVLPSNQAQLERGIRAVIDKGEKRVGVLGLSFKAGSDDLRESPMVALAGKLIAQGYDLRIYDRHLDPGALRGANRDFVQRHLPSLPRILVGDLKEVLQHGRTIVIGNADPEFCDVPRHLVENQTLVDFVRICDSRSIAGVYEGICW